MMELQLTTEEEELLLSLLQEQQTHLLREIAKAHHHEFSLQQPGRSSHCKRKVAPSSCYRRDQEC